MLGDYLIEPAGATTFYWLINWTCYPLDNSGEHFDMRTKTLVTTGDTVAVSQGKIIDDVVAGILRRQPTDTIPRTNVYLLDFVRGS